MSQADGYVRIVTQNDTTEARRSTEQLGDTIRDSLDTTPADRMSGALGGVQSGVEDTGNAAIKTGDIIKANLLSETIMKGVQQLGESLKGAAVHTVETADELNSSVNKIAAATGANVEDMERIKGVVEQIYGDNFGESFDDIADSVSKIKQNLGDLDDKSLVNVAESAYALQDVFDMGVEESSRAAKAMSENFGISAAEAYDYIAKGAQNGLNYSGELIDSINEYSVQFAKLGFSADDMFNIFSQGAENGAWNLDKVGDAIKELSIRVIDGSDTTKAGFEALGYNADSISAKFAEGGETARAAFQEVVSLLAAMDDPIAQNIAGVNLFGTMWEDLGVDAVRAIGNISDSAYDCAGAMDGIKDINYNSLSDSLDTLKRQIDLLIQPIGESLIPILDEAADTVSELAQEGDIKEIAVGVGNFISGTLTLLLKNLDLILSAVTGITAAVIAFKTANKLISVIQSWQTAALQVKLFAASEGTAALQTAATTGQLTLQEVVYGVLSGKISIATASTAAFNAVLNMNPAGAIAAVIGVLATVLAGFAISASSAAEETKELNENAVALNGTAQEADKAAQDVHKLIEEYKDIKSASDNTKEAKDRLKAIQDTLIETYDAEAEKLDLVNGKYQEQLGVLGEIANQKDENARLAVSAAYYSDVEAQKDAYSIDINSLKNEISEQAIGFIVDALTKAGAETGINAVVDVDNKMLKLAAGTSYEDIERYLQEFSRVFDDSIKELNAGGTISTNLGMVGYTLTSADTAELSTIFSNVSTLLVDVGESAARFAKNTELYNFYNNKGTGKSPEPSSSKPPTTDNSAANYLPDYWKGKSDDFKYWKSAYKFDYDMGTISANDYYTKLAGLRDEYLESDSDEWRSVTLEIKKYYDSLSEEQQKAYDNQRAEQKKAAEAAKAARKQAYNEEKSQLEFRLRTGKISEKKYYDELAKIRDKYLDKNSAEWRSAFLETYEYNQRILQENKDALNQLLTDTSDSTLSALQNITAARNSLTAKLTDFNKTFEKITETVPETIAVKGDFTITTAEHEVETYKMGADSIEDNIRVLEQYGDMLDALKSRGADEGTLNDILDMDIEEGMEFGSKLLKMSDREWNGYFDSMAKLRQTAADISAKYYQSEVESLKENFVDKLRKELDGLSTDMYKIGADVAKEFVSGWNEALGTKDLTVGELMRAVSGGTLDTAPRAAQQQTIKDTRAAESAVAGNALSAVSLPIYIGGDKLANILIDAVNGKIIKDGRNVLLT